MYEQIYQRLKRDKREKGWENRYVREKLEGERKRENEKENKNSGDRGEEK